MWKLKIESGYIWEGLVGGNRNHELSVDSIWKCSLFFLLPNLMTETARSCSRVTVRIAVSS